MPRRPPRKGVPPGATALPSTPGPAVQLRGIPLPSPWGFVRIASVKDVARVVRTIDRSGGSRVVVTDATYYPPGVQRPQTFYRAALMRGGVTVAVGHGPTERSAIEDVDERTPIGKSK